jgi:hypothetical protein
MCVRNVILSLVVHQAEISELSFLVGLLNIFPIYSRIQTRARGSKKMKRLKRQQHALATMISGA